MANFLDDLSIYNAKAAAAISAAVVECNNEKANMMSSLKTTANDVTLSEEIRLNALTALINLGNLLDIPLPPYFPSVTTYALTETFVGVHNDLDGIQGGAPGEYYHLTDAERTAILNKASLGDITWQALQGVYSDNFIFGPQFDAKQDGLVAPAPGTYFVKVTGNTVSYDGATYLSTISGIAAGGELTGTYPNPSLSNAAVIGKVLTGFDPFASVGVITASDTILSAVEKLNANIDSVILNPSGVASVAFTNNAGTVFTTAASPSTGAASLNLALNSQTANLVLASPNATTGQPLFRSLVVDDLPNSGVTATTYGSTTVIPQITVDAKGRITGVTNVTAASGGQVNTITLAVPSFLSPSNVNNALPASPEIVIQLDTQAANTVFAGPTTGVDAVPFFRLLVEDDIPQLSVSKITNLTNILNGFLTDSLSDGSIWIGNTSNAAVQRVLSGDVTVSNTGVTTIGLAKVQYNMIQDVTTQTLLGRYDAVDGEVQQITLSGDFVLNSGTGVLSLANPVSPVVSVKGDLLGHDLTNQQRVPSNNIDGSILLVNNSSTGVYTDLGLNWVAMSGDATINAAGAITIANNAVTLGKIAQITNATVLGNVSGATASPTALTQLQLTTLVNQFSIDTSGGNTGLKGVVPGFNINSLPAGKLASDYFLNASGAWSLGGGGSGSGTVSSGLQYQLAYYAANGTTVSGWTAPTANRALISNANGLPTHSATTATELGYVSGVTSAIQTQIDGKEPTISTLSIAKGGTNGSATPTAGAISYGTGTAYAFTAAGTIAGQILQSNVASPPTWTTATYPATTTINKILYSSSNNVVGQIDAPSSADTFLKWTGSAFVWDTAGSGSGTVNAGAQYALAYYPNATGGTVVDDVTISATNGTNFLTQVISGGSASAMPAWVVAQTAMNTLAGAATSGQYLRGNGTNVVMSAIQAGDVPTLNQNTAGSAASLTTARTILTDLASTTAGSFNGTLDINVGVTGVLPIARGGTAVNTVPANGQLLIGNGTGYTVASLVNGGGITITNGAGTITLATAAASPALNNIVAATGSNTPINNAQGTIQWNWSSNISTNAFVINSTTLSSTGSLFAVTHSSTAYTSGSIVSFSSTAVTSGTIFSVAHTGSSLTGNVASFTSTTTTSGTVLNLGISGSTANSAKNLVITNASSGNTSGRGIDVSISGATNSGNTYGAYISNTKTGTSSTNTALYLTASGGTINYALDVAAACSSRFGAGTASVPQLILTPSSAAGGTTFTGTVNGSLWYDTNSTGTANSSLTLYKDTLPTKIITKDLNPDFAVGSSFGVILASTLGTLSKSADLTALGVLATYSTYTVTTTATNIFSTVSYVGSTSLPANFFGTGKTILVVLNGQYTSTSGSPTLVLTLAFGTYSQTFTVNLHSAVNPNPSLWRAEFIITCSASGASGGLRTMAQAIAIDDTSNGTPKFTKLLLQTASSFNTTSASTISLNASYVSSTSSATIDMCQITYLN